MSALTSHHPLPAHIVNNINLEKSKKCVTINDAACCCALLLTFQGGMACPQLNSWRPGGEQDTDERSLARDRETKRGDRQRERRREVDLDLDLLQAPAEEST